MPRSRRHQSSTGSTSRCGCSTRHRQQAVCQLTTRRDTGKVRDRRGGRTSALAHLETERPAMASAASIGSARSCMATRKNAAITCGACHLAGYGMRCSTSTAISNGATFQFMTKRKSRTLQFAVLPWRIGEGGKRQIMLLTSRETHRWVIPKGWPMIGRPSSKLLMLGDNRRAVSGGPGRIFTPEAPPSLMTD